MKTSLAVLIICGPAVLMAQPEHRNYFSDDPFLTGGTKSVLIRPLQPQSAAKRVAGDALTVDIGIDTKKYPKGITSFKISADTKTYLIKKPNFEIVLWPNLLIITQDLAAGNVIIRSRQGFARVDPAEVLDYINARPEKIFIKVGSRRYKPIDCPADCSFVLGAFCPSCPRP